MMYADTAFICIYLYSINLLLNGKQMQKGNVKDIYTYARVSIPLINHHIFKAVVKPRNIPQPYKVIWYHAATEKS